MRGKRDHAGEDPYAVLGVSPSASSAQIKAAHRRLVRQVHPDCNPHPAASERFERVHQAYKLLIDPARRAALDAQRQRVADAERQRASEAAAVAGAAAATTRARAAATATSGNAQRAQSRDVGGAPRPAEAHARPKPPTQPKPPKRPAPAAAAEPVLSAEEAAEQLAAQLRDLGPPPPPQQNKSRADLRVIASWTGAVIAAYAGIIVLVVGGWGFVGALLLLCAPVLPWIAPRLSLRRGTR